MDDAKSQLLDRLKTANNVLVTVRRDPSVDQLSALLGLTLLLNKQGKHAAAVFSGQVPSTIEFLEPEETIEKNTDSLRDFIIALDKSKADKLRYKVEDNVVRIFITPYKTSITQADLDFSQGDFNVDLVIALGVQQQTDLDQAITAHGRILHDATIATINTVADGNLGSINWHDTSASSLSEIVTDLIEALDGSLVDNQIATALLTGIVAETKRFSNEKTTPQTMSMSAVLMSAGANQQLVASKLEEAKPGFLNTEPAATESLQSDGDEPQKEDGAIQIDHQSKDSDDDQPSTEPQLKVDEPLVLPELEKDSQPPTDEAADVTQPEENPAAALYGTGNKRITEPPQLGGMLTANTQSEHDHEHQTAAVNPMSLPTTEQPQLLEHKEHETVIQTTDNSVAPTLPVLTAPTSLPASTPAPVQQPEPVIPGLTPPPPAWVPPMDNPLGTPLVTPGQEKTETLSQLEVAVDSPHLEKVDLDDARDEVSDAIAGSDSLKQAASEPIQALNAQPFGGDLHASAPETPQVDGPSTELQVNNNDPLVPGPNLAEILNPATPDPTTNPVVIPPPPATGTQLAQNPAPTPQVTDPTAPPPVPPPIPFQFGTPGNGTS